MGTRKPGAIALTLGLALAAACSNALAPEREIRFVGHVEGLTEAMLPAHVTAAAHANDDCDAGRVLATAATQTDAQGDYGFALRLPTSITVCVLVAIETEVDGVVMGDTVRVGTVRPPVVESGDSVSIPGAKIRIVIKRP